MGDCNALGQGSGLSKVYEMNAGEVCVVIDEKQGASNNLERGDERYGRMHMHV